MNSKYQLAEINVSRMIGLDINDSIMKEFVDNLDQVNQLAENSKGFVWRYKDESNNATCLNPYNDVQVIINISVWTDIESLKAYVFKSFHTDFIKRRKEWFKANTKVMTAMWWIKAGHYPTVEEAVKKLSQFQEKGVSSEVFDFKNPMPKPSL